MDEGARSYRRSSVDNFPVRYQEPPKHQKVEKKRVRTQVPGEESAEEERGIKCLHKTIIN